MRSFSKEEYELLFYLAKRNNPMCSIWIEPTSPNSSEFRCNICKEIFDRVDQIYTHGIEHIRQSKLRLFL